MNDTNCAFCGNALDRPQYLDENGNYFCTQCLSLTGTCHLCSFGNCCDFETNPINLPKQEQKVIRQGNMVMQTVVKSEARIRETCLRNCPCFSEEFGCLKENGTCSKYAERTLNRPEKENEEEC